jgi:short-subunit dehydrogenase
MPLLDTDVSVAKKMFDVNVFAVIAVTQAFSPLLIASKGTVINIGSLAGKFPVPWQAYYNASKAAVNLLSDNLRIELKPFGVKVINVVTGGVDTKFFKNQPSINLPANSPYSPWRKQVEFIAAGGVAMEDSMAADKYARAVVKNALKTSPQVSQWAGGSTFIIWFVSTFLWHTVWVCTPSPPSDLYSMLTAPQDLAVPIVFKFPNWKRKPEAVEAK